MKIAIASGKGGTGKTLISTNLFLTAQKNNIPVTLVDCDAEEPNVAEFINGEEISSFKVSQNNPVIDPQKCVFCNKCFEYCNYNSIIYLPATKFIKVVDELCHDCGACAVACEFGAITQKEKLLGVVRTDYISCNALVIEARAEVGVYSPVPIIKKAIKAANQETLIFMDSPPGISCPFIATVQSADYTILVTEPTPFGLNDLKLSVETLQHLNKNFGVIINRSGLGNSQVYDWLKENNIPLLMEIPFSRDIARIYSEGRMLIEEMPDYLAKFYELINRITIK